MGNRRNAALATLMGSGSNMLISSVKGIVLAPLYMRYVGPTLYGAWLGSGDVLTWLQAFDLGLPNLMIQRIGYACGRDDYESVAQWLVTSLCVLCVLAALVVLVGGGVAFFLPRWMGLVGEDAVQLKNSFLIGVVATAISIINYGFIGFARGVQDTVFINAVTFIASLCNFASTLILLLLGAGVQSIAWGLLIQASIVLLGGIFFIWHGWWQKLSLNFRFNRIIFKEFVSISPTTALSSTSYATMDKLSIALVAIFLGPEVATVFGLTKKAADAAKSLLDAFSFSLYGSFAHLVGSASLDRILSVYLEIRSLRFSLALVLASLFLSLNKSFVSVWVGPEQFAGTDITVLLAINLVVVSGSFFTNYLYRAAGPVLKGSFLLFLESIVRIFLMIVLMSKLGLPGILIAAISTAIITEAIAYKWTLKLLSPSQAIRSAKSLPLFFARVGICLIGLFLCLCVYQPYWFYLISVGSILLIIGGGGVISLDPLQSATRSSLQYFFQRVFIKQKSQ